MDSVLDLDYHGTTRLFRARGLTSEPEFDLCRRFYELAAVKRSLDLLGGSARVESALGEGIAFLVKHQTA